MEGGLLLDVIIRESPAVFELLTSEDKSLLVRGDALLVLDLIFHIVDGVRRLDLQRDSLAGHYRNRTISNMQLGEENMAKIS